MSDLKKYEGVIPTFYTCYNDQKEVSPERTRALVQYFIDKGVQGLYVNGFYLLVLNKKRATTI